MLSISSQGLKNYAAKMWVGHILHILKLSIYHYKHNFFIVFYRVKNKNYAFLCFLFLHRFKKLGAKKGVSGYVLKFILFKILKFPFFKDFIILSFSNLFFYLLPDTKKIRIIIENRTGKREHKKA
jgi:hypothetical protein